MDALPDIVKTNPDAYIIIVGGDSVSYGNIPEGNKSYKEIFLIKLRINFRKLIK